MGGGDFGINTPWPSPWGALRPPGPWYGKKKSYGDKYGEKSDILQSVATLSLYLN